MNRLKKLILLMAVLSIAALLSACDIITPEPDGGQSVDPNHVHKFYETGKDSTGHWLYCKDDNVMKEGSKNPHVDVDYDGICNICGYKMGNAHTHTFTVLDYDTVCHWLKCPSDGAKDTREEHVDENKDGKCDVCSLGMPLPAKEYIGIDSINYVYTLVVRGAIPEGVACIKLHYEVNGVDYFVSNTAGSSISYVFSLPLDNLPVENAPLYRFDLYTYASVSPSDYTAYSEKINLVRGDFISEDIFEYKGNTYTIIDSEPTLAIQAEVTPEFTVNSIELKMIERKPYVVVCGIAPKRTPCIKLHADGKGGANYYGDDVSNERGKFELKMDISQVPYEEKLFLYFNTMTYDSAEPEDYSAYYKKRNLARNALISAGTSVEYDGIIYTVLDYDRFIIGVTEAPTLKVSEIVLFDAKIDGDYIVIKGANRSIAKCVKLHVDADGKNDKYWENVAYKAKEGDLEFRVKISDIDLIATWSFHIYAYLEEEPSSDGAYDAKVNINRGENFTLGQTITHNGMVYTVVSSNDGADALALSVTAADDGEQ